ncbi:MAG TPA: ABC transporter ATP-binding protein [Patescibacteria group bacterium]|nr:ABC transporter ATP-binding protein [Patescibacteria group bacterium]
MAKKQTIITAEHVTAGYGENLIWQDATFTIGKGEFVGILGSNGAGKTTLFRLLLGLIRPASGELTLLGETPRRGHPRVGYIPQRRPIDSEMNIEALELVRLGLHGHHWGITQHAEQERKRALKALQTVDAEALAHRPLGVLSGGELQRIFLAQALIGDPDILLLDEPLANLDIRREINLIQLVDTIVRTKDVTALLIAHDLNPLLPVLDRVIYIANKQVATGKPDEIVASESLSNLYGAPVEVLRDSRGRVAVLGAEEASHPHV